MRPLLGKIQLVRYLYQVTSGFAANSVITVSGRSSFSAIAEA
jgi:hypothetical protein